MVEYADLMPYILKEDSVPSDELLLYDIFRRKSVLWRLTQLGTLQGKNDLVEYPKGCLIHILDDNYLMNKPIVFVPDVDGFAMNKLPYRKFIYHVTAQPERTCVKDVEEFILPPRGLIPTMTNFRRRYISYIKTVKSPEDFPDVNRSNTQCVISYLSLYRARIFGLMRTWRRTKYVWSALINEMAKYPDRMHFIPVPVGTRELARTDLLRTYKAYTKQTLKYENDPWWLFCINLFGFLHDEPTDSLFEKIPKSMWDKVHFVLHTDNNMLILRLDYLKEFNKDHDVIMVRFLKLINALAATSRVFPGTTTEDLPPKIEEKIDETLPKDEEEEEHEHEEKVPVAPKPAAPRVSILKTNKPFSAPVDSGTPERQMGVSGEPRNLSGANVAAPGDTEEDDSESKSENKTPLKPAVPPETTRKKIDRILKDLELSKLKKPPQPIVIDDDWIEVQEEETVGPNANMPGFSEELGKAQINAFVKGTTERIDAGVLDYLDNHPELSPAQRQRCEKRAQEYKSVKIGNTTVGELLDAPVDESINESDLDFLKDEVADPSMLDSSLAQFDSDYKEKMAKKDMVGVLASFNKVGMFLTGIQEEDCSDPLNKSTRYKVSFEDINRKTHTINFVLPKIDERGFCYVNGTYKILKKQRVPLPICKVSNTRVTLNSDYNKYLIERNVQVAHSFLSKVESIFEKHKTLAKLVIGRHDVTTEMLPYEYTAIASKYTSWMLDGTTQWWMFFDHSLKAENLASLQLTKEQIDFVNDMESDLKATWVGWSQNSGEPVAAFMNVNGELILKWVDDEHVERTTMLDFLCDLFNERITPLSEWTDFKLLSTKVPTIFALCYRFGLSHMLNYTKARYRIYGKNERFPRRDSDVVVRFSDATLVIPRVPLTLSLLFAGLNWFDLRQVSIDQMDSRDIYYDLIQSKKISAHQLKSIDNYFNYFVDPITADVLNQMKEPTTAKDLLIRATQLLATENHRNPASSMNFRFRSYERVNSAIYRVMTKAHSTFANKGIGATHKFSIADYEIKQLITQDQLMENVDFINPINDVKYNAEYSHSGFGGRQNVDTFTVEDRQFPDDGVGIIGEATVDSSKTAYIASMSADPGMVNLRGMTIGKNRAELKPTQVLTPTALLVPGVSQDDKQNCHGGNAIVLLNCWKLLRARYTT